MKVFLVAGEASGDALGAALMAGLKALVPDATFDGVGGPLMREQGLVSRFPMDELSVMGLAEVLPRYLDLRRRMIETADAVLNTRPDVLVTIDSPDFCLRVAARVRRVADIRIVHYVAPSVWAWRPRRAERMAAHVDQVLALLPFEPPYLEAAGLRCDFVGHPVVSQPQASAGEVASYRAAHPASGPRLLILPGSRRSEIARLGSRFGAARAVLSKRHPGLAAEIVVAPGLGPMIDDMTADWPATQLVRGEDAAAKRTAFAAADVALAASGTVSLELAAAGTPMVIGYDMAPLSRWILSKMLRIDTVTLVNLVAGTRAVPECLGRACTPDNLADALDQVLADPSAQETALETTMQALGRDGEAPGLRAARAVIDGLP